SSPTVTSPPSLHDALPIWDCSVQRRFQKVVEVAPSVNLSEETRNKLYNYAVAIARESSYDNVGTVEFLVDQLGEVFFIEVNPRRSEEHTSELQSRENLVCR